MNRHTAIKHVKRVLGPAGAHQICRLLTSQCPRIFMYHRFSAVPSERRMHIQMFEQQLRLIAANFHLMPMRDLASHVEKHGRPPPRVAVITIDDGHADFYELAFPVLKKLGIPSTLYLTSEFVNGGLWLWPDRLEYALFNSADSYLNAEGINTLPLHDSRSKWAAWRIIVDRCTSAPDAERRRLLREVESACGVDIPEQPTAENRAINWEQAREMLSDGVEIGAHTRTHPILSRISDESLGDEILGSKLDIEAEIQNEVASFCYPNGMHQDFNATVKQKTRAAGFRSAVVAYFDDDDWSDLFEIKRIPGSSDRFDFSNKLYGMDQVIQRWIRRSA